MKVTINKSIYEKLKENHFLDLHYKKWDINTQQYIDISNEEKINFSIKMINTEELNVNDKNTIKHLINVVAEWNSVNILSESKDAKNRYQYICNAINSSLLQEKKGLLIFYYANFLDENNPVVYGIGIFNVKTNEILFALSYPDSQYDRKNRSQGVIGLAGGNIINAMLINAFEKLNIKKITTNVISPKIQDFLSKNLNINKLKSCKLFNINK